MNRLLTIAVALSLSTTALADWTKVAPGVDYQHFTIDSMDIHVTRVDLTSDEVRVVVTRESDRGLRVSDFAKKLHAVAAINADYFDQKMNPVGLTVGACGVWNGTKDTSREGVIAVGTKQARIDPQKAVMDPVEDWVDAAVSGWPLLVKNCEAFSSSQLPGSDAFTRSPHPRTAVGLSKDRKTLYLLVADGRRKDAPGLTLAQLAKFFADELDACTAMNLDGGGSAAMWVNDRIVNKPSDGIERKVADHIAVVLARDFDPQCEQATPDAPVTTGSPTTTGTTIAPKPSSKQRASASVH